MSTFKIAVRDNRAQFWPGEEISGAAGWQLDKPPKAVELRLIWFTRGKGTTDAEVVVTVRFDQPQIEEARPFQFVLPDSPYSFSGKLISLIWALELVVKPSDEAERLEITVSPTGQELLLHKTEVVAAGAPPAP